MKTKLNYRFLLSFIVFLFFFNWVKGQDTIMLNKKIYLTHRINIGEKCPDFILHHIMNYPDNSAKISDFKGKYIILDFWSTGCAGCIDYFPVIENMQKKHPDDLRFILVNFQSEDSTKHFFARRKHLKMPDLPMVSEDTTLHKAFPHFGDPFEVWIDKSGIVRALTDGDDVTDANINKALQGGDMKLEVANAAPISITHINNVPLINEGNGQWLPNLKVCSYIMCPAVTGIATATGYPYFNKEDEQAQGLNTIDIPSSSIIDLFRYAFADGHDFYEHKNCTFLQVMDSSRYVYPTENEGKMTKWAEQNSYTYQLRVPPDRKAEKYAFMREDLERYFCAKGHIERRNIPCWVLIRTSSTDKMKSKGGKPVLKKIVGSDGDADYIFNNKDFGFLARMIDGNLHMAYDTIEPFIDDTGYHGNVDLNLHLQDIGGNNFHTVDIEGIKKAIKPYDLDLVKEYRVHDVLVITEDNYHINRKSDKL